MNLVTNAVVLWNTVYMERALEKRRCAGHDVDEDDMVHLSPVRYAHINPYGKYDFSQLPSEGAYRSLRA